MKIQVPYMNLKQILFTFILCFFSTYLNAQPEPCDDPAVMTSTCPEACIICDIDGYTGRHESNVNGILPNTFCTTTVHNAQWIAFQAGSENLSIKLDVSNCVSGQGLEITIYEGIDCENFKLVANCLGSVQENTSGTITTNQPLVIGQYYYLVMDGNWGDNCDWTLTVLEGSTEVDPLEESGDILGDDATCPELLQQYVVDFPIGATEFDWTINGILLPTNEPMIEYEFPIEGTYSLCVTSRNVCDVAPPTCRQITIESVPVTEIVEVFCENEFYIIEGDTITETGIYQYDLLNVDGCDSIVIAELEELITPYLSIDVDICDGDTLYIGTTPFTQSGIYQELLTSFQQCDSIIDLDLFVIICNITSTGIPIPAICNGTATGQINFNVDNGSPPFTYSWGNLNNTHSGNGIISAVDEIININNIPKGTYLITIQDGFGNSDIIITDVTEPAVLMFDFQVSDYGGTNISCAGRADGTLEANVSGGVSPYFFNWSNGQNSSLIQNLSAGEYIVTISDNSGCELIGSYILNEPDALFLSAGFNNADCDGFDSGSIEINQTSGGVAPYSYFLNGEAQNSNTIFESLSSGTYEIEAIDNNGCSISITDNIEDAEIPVIDLGEDYSIMLGDLVNLNPSLNNISIQNIQWVASEFLSCEDCLNPEVTPLFSGQYLLEIISEDGCVGVDSVFINVEKFRRFYAPTAFSPNFDGYNDFFTLFGGSEVASIKKLLVFNRWGAVVYEGIDLTSADGSMGWDGQFKGKSMNSGVFAWIAEIEFIDGVVETHSGDVTLVK